MADTGIYLNLPGNTEEAFNFYKSVFGGEFVDGGISRFDDAPHDSGLMLPLAEEEKSLIMHITLLLPGGVKLMGTDMLESIGFKPIFGNTMHIYLDPDTREETKRLFAALSADGTITMPLEDMFWGAFYGTCTDQFGVQWMFNCTTK